ncbi:MAG: hypothetical protein J5933_06100, partial [Clostridia bacterium]|nr:hypothetical protein [Clostridia bacterium]
MKRALLAVLAALLCLSLASCITINIPSNMVPGETVTQQPVETDPVTEAPTDDTTGSQTPDQPQVSYTDIVKGFDATIEETVLLDDRDVKVTATDLRFEDGTAYLTVKAENNTDMKLIFIAGSSYYNLNSINGYMVGNGYLYEKIEAGESKDLEMEFGMGEMIAYGIRNIAEIGTG